MGRAISKKDGPTLYTILTIYVTPSAKREYIHCYDIYDDKQSAMKEARRMRREDYTGDVKIKVIRILQIGKDYDVDGYKI